MADEEALARLEHTLAREAGDRRLRVLRLPHDALPAFQVWFDRDTEALVTSDGVRMLDRWEGPSRLVPFLFGLHAHLLGGETASTANGVAALVLVALATTGIVVWWPRRATFPLGAAVPRDGSRRTLLRSHVAIGTVLALPIVFFGATGAALVFNGTVMGGLSAGMDATPARRPDARVVRTNEAMHALATLATAARRTFPEGELTMYMPGSGENAVATFRMRMPGEMHPNGRTYVLVNPYTADVVQQIDARQQGLGTRLGYAIYPLHAARGSGGWLALPAVVTGLGLTWLSVGGLFTFVRKVLHARAARRQPARTVERPAYFDDVENFTTTPPT